MSLVLLIILGIIIFPVYVYFIVMFAYMGKLAGLRITFSKTHEQNKSSKGEDRNV